MFMLIFLLLSLNAFTPEITVDFARKLESEGDYYRAILEYKRAFYLLPDSGSYKYIKDDIAYSIVKLYEKLHDFDMAEVYLDKIRDRTTENYLFERGLVYFLKKDYDNAKRFWKYSDTLTAWIALREGRFKDAEKVFGKISYPHRVPFIAAFLSGVIPGLGKVYSGRLYDGIYSFILNAGSLYLLYDAKKHNRKAETYLYSALFLFFYTGNIYGSWIAASKFNEYHLNFAIKEKEISFGLWKYLP